MNRHLTRNLLLAPTLAFVLCVGARAEETTNTVKFSDPSKPGTLKIQVGRGELRIQGTDTNEVSVKSDARPVTSKRKDGLREISSASGFSLTEKDNVINLETSVFDWGKRNTDFQLTVPRNTTVVVQNVAGGDINCTGITGDLEINSMHGTIKLDDVSGGVVVSTMNGEIRAGIRELREGKTLSFTSMNGEVHLRLDPNARANVRLRTQNGSVLTDFDENVLVTKAEASGPMPRISTSFSRGRDSTKVLTTEIQEAIREATSISATAVREALEAVREGLNESRINTDEARRQFESARQQMDRARSESDRARRESERVRVEAERTRVEAERERRVASRTREGEVAPAAPAAPAAPVRAGGGSNAPAPKPAAAPVPAKHPAPTITGGKLVTGTLNGGGPEISVSTMNGDVILRKNEAPRTP